jgi:hypothetical protein
MRGARLDRSELTGRLNVLHAFRTVMSATLELAASTVSYPRVPRAAHVSGAGRGWKASLGQDDICHIEFVIDLTTARTGRSA